MTISLIHFFRYVHYRFTMVVTTIRRHQTDHVNGDQKIRLQVVAVRRHHANVLTIRVHRMLIRHETMVRQLKN